MAEDQVPVGSVEITSYHDFDEFVQQVPEIARGFNLPVDLKPEATPDPVPSE